MLQRARFRVVLVLILFLFGARDVLAQPVITTGSNLGTWQVGHVETPFTATGGTGVYTWELTAGSLPPGTSLRTDGPTWFAAGTGAGLIGVATTPGTYDFTLRVSSGGLSATRAFTIRFTAFNIVETWYLPDAFVGVPFAPYALGASSNAGPVTWSPNGPLPPGMSLSPAGVLSGTPTASGSYSISLRAFDGVDAVFRSLTLNVYDIRVTSPRLLTATQFEPFTSTIEVAGGTAPFTFSACTTVFCSGPSAGLPTGLALDSATGVISGIPTGIGPTSITLTVTDATHVSYSTRMSIVVIGVPPALPRLNVPFFGSDCTVGWSCDRNVPVSFGGRPPFNYTASGLPRGLAIRSPDGRVDRNASPTDGQIYGVPTEAGTFNVTITVTDADGATTTNTFPYHVTGMVLTNHPVDQLLDTPFSHTLRIIGGPSRPSAPGPAVSGTGLYTSAVVSGRFHFGLTYDTATLTLSGTPRETNSEGATIRFVDAAGGQLDRFVGFNVLGPGNATMQTGTFFDLGTSSVGSAFSRQLLACCAPSYAWTFVSGELPPGISLSSAGVLTGTFTTAGTFEFVLQVADATFPSNFARQYLIVRVLDSTLPAFFINPSQVPHGNLGTALSIPLTATGGTLPLTWGLLANNYLPPGLSVSPTDGTISGTPTSTGQYSFNVSATDATGRVASRFISISIYPAGVLPPLGIPIFPFITGIPGTFLVQLTTAGGVPPYSYSLTPGATPIPGMRVQDGQPLPTNFSATGGLIGVITEGGVYDTSVRVTDSAGQVFDRAIRFTVNALRIFPDTTPPRASVGEPYSHAFSAFGGSGSYSWSVDAFMPPGLSLGSDGRIVGTPTQAGTFSPRITLLDLVTGVSFAQNFTIGVNPFAITTPGVLPRGTVGIPYIQTLEAPGCLGTCTWTGGVTAGLTLSSSGVLSGTPTFATVSSLSLTVSGSNGTVSKLFLLQVANSSPTGLAINNQPIIGPTVVGGISTTTLNASGGLPPYTWTLRAGSVLPPGITFYPSGDLLSSTTTPGLSYLHGRAMQVGVYTFTFDVTDGAGAVVSRTFTWNVTALSSQFNSLPVAGQQALVFGTAYSQPLLAIGGSNQYTWTALSPLPPGLALNAASGVVTGTPTNTGSFTVPIRIDDDAGNFTTANVAFNIASPSGITIGFSSGANLGTSPAGTSFAFNMTPTGGTGPYTVTALTPLPPGMALLSGDSLTSGTTATFQVVGQPPAGMHTFTLRADDSAGNFGVRTFTLVIASVTLLNTGLPDASVGVAYAQTLNAFDNGGAVTWSVPATTTLPPGLSLSATGVLQGTPTQAASYSFTVTATGSSGAAIGVSLSLRVSNIAIAGDTMLPQGAQGQTYSHTFTATGAAGPLTWSGNAPAGLTLSSTGILSGTPTGSGLVVVNVTATDGTVPVTRRFTLLLIATNPGVLNLNFPVISDAIVGQLLTVSVSATGGTPPYTWALAPGSVLPPGLQLTVDGTTSGISATISGLLGAAGTYAFDLVLSDASGVQTRRTLRVHVAEIQLLGTTSLRPGTAGTAYAHQLVAVGGTAPYTFSIAPAGVGQDALPVGITMSPAGLFSGTATTTGFHNFLVTVTDAAARTLTRQYSVQFLGTLGLQVSAGNLADAAVGTGRTTTFSASGQGVTSVAWSIVSGSLPPGLAFTQSGNLAIVSGAPSAPGNYAFTVRAADTANGANFADRLVRARVAPMQIVSPPVEHLFTLELPSGEVGVSYSHTFRAAGGAAPYSFSVSSQTPLPAGLALSPAGVLSGTPQQVGVYGLGIIVADGGGNVLDRTNLTLVIAPAGRPSPLLRSATPSADASVGAPYTFRLDSLVRNGRAPISWTAEGATLPPGLSILSAPGVGDYFTGVPTTPGTFPVALEATDAAGQVLAFVLNLRVSAIALSPETLAPGRVGSPYAATIAPSGGSAPYTFALTLASDLPAGLSLSAGGVLSGTPTHAGNYSIFLTVTDGSALSVNRIYRITIDNGAGEAPAVNLSPRPIQIYYEMGSPAPAPTAVSIATTSGAYPFTAAVAGVTGLSLDSPAGSTSTVANLSLDTSLLTPGTYVGLLAAGAPGTANRFDSVPVTLTVAPAPPCEYAVNPPNRTVPWEGGTGSFNVLAGNSCAWTAVASAPWIHITSAAAGSGGAAITYRVDPSVFLSQRSGTITVNGVEHLITQFGLSCSFALSPPLVNATANGGTARIGIVASNASCAWTASGLGVSPASGTGSAMVDITVPPTSDVASRVLTATIATQTLTVNQSGIACTVGLSPYEATVPATGATGSVTVTVPPGCSYSTLSGPSWITVTSGGTGEGGGTLVYTVDPNSLTEPRVGTLTIGGQAFRITQLPVACSVTLDTSALGTPYAVGGGTGTIGITANGANCSWTAESETAWASLSSAGGTGNGTITVTASSNASSTTERTGTVRINGQAVHLSQAGTTCSYALQSPAGSVPGTGGNGSVGVVAAAVCGWTSVSNNTDWLTITASGTAGTSDVRFTALANQTGSPRIGTLTVAGLTYTVTQAPAPCAVTLPVTNTTAAATGVTGGTVGFTTALPACAPAPVSFASWLTISGSTFSNGSGQVTFDVAPNPLTVNRVGTIQIGDRAFTVTQLGGACGYSLQSYGVVFGPAGGDSSVVGSQSALGCTPVYGTDQPAFVVLGVLVGPLNNIFTLPFTVTPFTTLTSGQRIARINFGGVLFIVKQNSY